MFVSAAAASGARSSIATFRRLQIRARPSHRAPHISSRAAADAPLQHAPQTRADHAARFTAAPRQRRLHHDAVPEGALPRRSLRLHHGAAERRRSPQTRLDHEDAR